MKRALPLLLLLATALAAAQTTDGRRSGLKASDLQKIRATKLRFLVPTRVPAGYRATRVELERNKDPMLVTLSITYRKGGSEITVQQASEGIGDLPFTEEADSPRTSGAYDFRSPVLGRRKQSVEYQREKGKPQWIVNWIELPGKRYPRFLSAYGRNSPGREGVTLMESLRFLK